MSKVSRRTLLGAGTAALAIAAGKLANPGSVGAQSKQLNLYSSRHYNTDSELYDGFTRRTGIKVNLIEGKGDALIERIVSEGRNSPADIFLTVDAGRLWKAEQRGIFAPVDSNVLKSKIPASFRHPNNLWFGFSKRARVVMYNRDTVNPARLSTYEDLATPKWRGKILIRSSSNVYNQSLVAWLIANLGAQATEAWARGVVANFAREPQGNDRAQIEGAASGIGSLAIANTYYLPRYNEPKDKAKMDVFKKIGVYFPKLANGGTHVNISGGGMLKNAPNKDAAVQFLEYLVSSSAQVFFAQGNSEYPIVSGVAIDPVVASFGRFNDDDTNVSVYGRNAAEAVRIMDRVGWK
ncbi:extracellular solute-binding protein family 1 [Thalassoporum mexicanum PCC 7367]|uniref:Fe(3+) ABC transporter substrate-binding protein n=1 Tax=Thalassoporum mexicanum TaxID=3457544 RepID=UPI00029FAFE1|nr:Fe(3+) ABC transporter substrate-binding protein [Pseudanabaena sp. PCC 7367]AFY70232.1 extracellular solute-binding protein family 1 [Pseudanabaena sp. PCC 7367]